MREHLDRRASCVLEEDPSGTMLGEILPLAVDVSAGMSYMHGEGIVHGDMKSDNVMLQYSPELSR